MNVDELLTRLQRANVKLSLQGDNLRVSASKGVLDAELRDLLSENKAQVINALSLARSATALSAPPLQRLQPAEAYPVSFAQERLWFLDQLEPGNAFYNMPLVIGLRGILSVSSLLDSLRLIVSRHDALRTRFAMRAGRPLQLIDKNSAFEMEMTDISALPNGSREPALIDLMRAEALQPFDLGRDSLVRAKLIKIDEDDHVLLFTMHHIISDGWSLGVLFRELGACYAAFSAGDQPDLAELPIQYADFAVWQREWLSGDVLESQLAYWKQQLDGLAALELPTDRPRPALPTYTGAIINRELSSKLSNQLTHFSRQAGVSLFVAFFAGFAVLLHRYSGQDDIVVGSPIANRNRSELEGLIGFFVNSLAMRADVSGEPDFRELLQRVNEMALGAFDHQDLPFEKLVDEIQPERNLGQNPLFQVMFALRNTPRDPLELKGLTLAATPASIHTTRFDLEVYVSEISDLLSLSFVYNTDLFDADTIKRMMGHYQSLLEAMVTAPDMRIGDAPMLGEQERQQLVIGWNQTKTDYPREQTVQSLVEAQVMRAADSVALEHAGELLSYRELNERANRLAHYLIEAGVKADVAVVVSMERTPELIIAQLAVLKSGGAYVAIDPDIPTQRLGFILQDTRSPLLLTQSSLLERVGDYAGRTLCLDSEDDQLSGQSTDNPAVSTTPENLAYVIYTSGSTGQPKGVEVSHGGLSNLVAWHRRAYEVGPADRATHLAGLGFDASVWELWPYLASGARLYLVSDEQRLAPAGLWSLMVEKGITLSFLPTPLAEAALGEPIPQDLKLRVLLTGGDRLHGGLVAEPLPFRVVNHYGPTENSVVATSTDVDMCAAQDPPIGRPIDNVQTYILDKDLQPVPVGVWGELYIGGDSLARGYLNQPQLTAEKFIPNPFSDEAGARLYRSGDLVRYRADGQIEFRGRIDYQVKLRGFRVELGEIETALLNHEALQDAVAIVREDEPGDKRIAAYLVASPAWMEQISSNQSGEHVGEWQALYEETYANIDEAQDLITNFTGWNSSYTGEPIPLVEMEEWQASTVARITALHPVRVLEIGCGTGLLLFRLAPECERYVGTDFSAVAQRQLHEVVTTHDEYKNVELWHRTADDFSDVEPGEFDTVIINSVTQYLPSMDYLADVVDGAIAAIADGGRILLGDIRSLPLLKAYHTSVQLYLSPDDASGGELLRNIQQHVEEENELVIEPAFFHALKQQIPRISHVEILLKQGQYHNELSGYRYDVVLHVEARGEALPQSGQWLDWSALDLNETRLHDELDTTDREWLGIRAMPNARVYQDVAVLTQLQGEGSAQSVGELKQVVESDQRRVVEPSELWSLAEAAGYQLELSYSGAGTDGRMDALFRRSRREDCAGRVFWPQQQAVPQRPWSAYGTNPLKGRLGNELIPLLRQDLQQQLPEYMLPSAYVLLDALPLNPNGKVDRKVLPVPGDVRASLGAEYTAPRSTLEQQLAGIWAEVLKLERVGIHDNFFDLGGHSLMATQVVSRIRAQLQVELPLSQMFGYPTVTELAPLVEALLGDCDGETAEVISVADRNQPLPLSFAQERFWFLNQLEPESSAYNMLLALRLRGELNVTALTKSLKAMVQRHETLRTHFDLHQGAPIQIIDDVAIHLVQDDLSELPADARQGEVRTRVNAAAIQSFDLSTGPLLRCRLLHLSRNEHVLLLTMHHIASDGWSMGVLFRELGICYTAFSKGEQPILPELPIQYADFAVWQRDYLSGDVLASQQAYWQRELADLSTLDLPTDRPRPAIQSHAGAFEILHLDAKLSGQLKVLSQQAGVTLFMTLLAGFAVLMQRYSGQEDVVVGTPIANRNHAQVEGLIGFFINSLVMRTDVSGNPGFRQLLQQVQATALEAYQHQDLPFENLVEILQPRRDRGRNPLFQVQFAVQNAPLEPPDLEGLRFELIRAETQQTIFDLECHIGTRGTEFDVRFVYNTELFDTATIQRMQQHYRKLLQSVVVDPDRRITELTMLSAAEQQQFDDWNHTSLDYPRTQTVPGLFEQQVRKSPNADAVEYDGHTLSYGELNARSNQLAHYLQQRGAGAGTIVGICVERSLEMVVGLMAILKAGCAYLPLDPDYPVDRLNYMLEDSGAELLLSKGSLPAGLVMPDSGVVCFDRDVAAIAEQDDANLAPTATADDLVYVIYTSGSTGRPKGVMGLHRGIVNRLLWGWAAYPYAADERCCQKTTLNFVDSVAEIFSPLLAGLCLVVADEATLKDVRALARLVSSRGVTRLMMVPSLLRALLDLDEEVLNGLDCVRHWVTGGERLEAELEFAFRARFPAAVLLNFYGSSEVSADVTCFDTAERGARTGSLIGRPIANTRTYVLDGGMHQVPVGVPGELYIGGDGLARGYQNRPELTAERFVPDPFSAEAGARLYRMGDRVRYLADGNLEFLGRTDDQVKLRGFRIELGEIETALIEQTTIRDAVAIVREGEQADKQLVAYVVPTSEWMEQNVGNGREALPSLLTEEHLYQELIPGLRQQLRQQLPAYMVPSTFVLLEVLPVSPNGKVDRAALPKPGDAGASLETEYVEPRSALERQISGIWVEILKIERVGIHDNFFDLGGHSLMATQVVSRILNDLRVELPVSELFVYPTVAELAHRIESGQGIAAGADEQIKRTDAAIDPTDLDALSDQQVAELLSELSRSDNR